MAKTIAGVEAVIQLRRTPAGVWELRNVSYNGPLDDTDTGIRYVNQHNFGAPKNLTLDELNGTLQIFLDSCDAAYKSANSIA